MEEPKEIDHSEEKNKTVGDTSASPEPAQSCLQAQQDKTSFSLGYKDRPSKRNPNFTQLKDFASPGHNSIPLSWGDWDIWRAGLEFLRETPPSPAGAMARWTKPPLTNESQDSWPASFLGQN